jgi:hypothetical protein
VDQVADSAAAPQRAGDAELLWAVAVDQLLPDGPLHGLPLPALRLQGRYLVEDVEVVGTFSGALYVYQAHTRRRTRGGWARPWW